MSVSMESKVNEQLTSVKRYLSGKTLERVMEINRFIDLCHEAKDARAQLTQHAPDILKIDTRHVKVTHRLIENIDAEMARTVAKLCRILSGLLKDHLDSDKKVDKAKADHATLVTKLGKTGGYFRPNQTLERCMRQATHIEFLNRAPAVRAAYGQFDKAQQHYLHGRALQRDLADMADAAEAQFKAFAGV